MKTFNKIGLLIFASLLVAPVTSSAQDIVEIASGDENFSTLVAALQAADLVETLQGEGPFTVFAPTNAAFEALPEGTVENLLLPENVDQLTNILLYHVVPGSLMASDVTTMPVAKTATSTQQLVEFSVTDDGAFIDNALISTTDIEASNGVIHVIDAVILPDELSNIVDTAVNAGTFSTLVTAVEALGLVETLQGEGPFTVFAPSDDAFAALPEGTLDSLLAEEGLNQLREIVLFHVVSGKVTSPEVLGLDSATTINDLTLNFSVVDESVMVENATVVTPNIDTSNGIIHVIDQVMLPQSGVKHWKMNQ